MVYALGGGVQDKGVVHSDMEWLRLAPQDPQVKSNIYSVRSAVHTVSRRGVKGSFQTAGQQGCVPPSSCNFPKPPNQQASPPFTATGQVRIGEKWAEVCIPACSAVRLLNQTIHVCATIQICFESLLAHKSGNTNTCMLPSNHYFFSSLFFLFVF